MAHILEYIGSDDDTYVYGHDGNDPSQYANMQTGLNIGDTLQQAYIVSNRTVKEDPNNPTLYDSYDELYYKYNYTTNNMEVDSVSAVGIPKYLAGWRTSSSTLVTNNQVLTPAFVENNFVGSNLDLHAMWMAPYLIRVIVYVPTINTTLNLRYDVSISATTSYDTTQAYYLTQNYKSIHDNGTGLEFTDGTNVLTNFGYGDGCPDSGVVTYFAVKNGGAHSASIELTPSTGYSNDYIPSYVMNGSNPVYNCYIAERLVRKEKTPEVCFDDALMQFSAQNSKWTISGGLMSDIDGDRTVFVPLVAKPVITVNVSPSGSGTATGGGTYMPGETCTLTATAGSGSTFDHWDIGGLTIQSQTYGFTVTTSKTATAYFNTPSAFYYSYFVGPDGTTVLLPGFVYFQMAGSSGAYHMTNTIQSKQINTGVEVTLSAYRYADSLQRSYVFAGWYSYVGNTMNPSHDTLLTEDVSSDQNVSRYKFTMNGTDVKIYAAYGVIV